MLRISPRRYIADQGIVKKLGSPLESLGERALVIADKSVLERFEEVVRGALKESMIGVSFEVCLGKCCLPEVERLVEEVKKEKAGIVVGMGGGTTVDVAKYVGQMSDCKVVTVPTVASSCAAFTNIVHLYSDDGDFIEEVFLEQCPDLLVLDHKVAGLASSNYLAAGMAVAYGVTLENGQKPELRSEQIAGELSTDLCDFLRENVRSVIADVKKGEVTTRLKNAVETVILEAGLVHTLWGENRPVPLVHQFVHQLHPFVGEEVIFGEVMGFAMIVCKVLRSADIAELKPIFGFCRDLSLPLHLEALGLSVNQKDTIIKDVAEAALEQLTAEQVSVEFSVKEFVDAIETADKLGGKFSEQGMDALT